MIYLTEISVPVGAIRDVVTRISPLTAPDPDYAAKAWMALDAHAGVACRPWRQYRSAADRVRIVGWRKTPPSGAALGAEVRVASRAVAIEPGEVLTLSALIVPIRRTKRVGRDAGGDCDDRAISYRLWLQERLVDIASALKIDDGGIAIGNSATVRSLRKKQRRPASDRHAAEVTIGYETFPRLEVTVTGQVTNPARVEEWLLQGVGPQKAFGYGAFLPC